MRTRKFFIAVAVALVASTRFSTGASGNTAHVIVRVPNTSTLNWGIGSHQRITWTQNLGASATFKIEVSRDGGATFPEIVAAAAPAVGEGRGPQWFTWEVTGPATSVARIRVTSNDVPSATDESDVNFTIAPAFITIVSPKSPATNWGYGTQQQITWKTNLNTLLDDTIQVQLSTDGGSTFPTTLDTVGRGPTSALIVTPTMPTTTARVAIVWSNAPAGLGAAGIDPVNFKIAPPFVKVGKPNGGEVWPAGSTQLITTTSNLGMELKCFYVSPDGGATYFGGWKDQQTAFWFPTPAGWNTHTALARVTWCANPSVSDTSNTTFSIVPE